MPKTSAIEKGVTFRTRFTSNEITMPNRQEKQLKYHDAEAARSPGRLLSYPLPSSKMIDKHKAADPDDDIGDRQTGKRRQQFAGQDIGASHRFRQQKVGRQFSFLNRDQ